LRCRHAAHRGVGVVIATLIIVVCLADAPDICREEQPSVDMDNSVSCMMHGQHVAAQWLADHPGWILRGWRCRFGGGRDI
jgi:hypothetical protein